MRDHWESTQWARMTAVTVHRVVYEGSGGNDVNAPSWPYGPTIPVVDVAGGAARAAVGMRVHNMRG